jgi:TonB family protein
MTGGTARASAARRAAVLGAVIVAHLGVLAAFVTEFSASSLQPVSVPVQASIIEQRRLSPPPPPPPPRVRLPVPTPALASLQVAQPMIDLPAVASAAANRPARGQYLPLALLSQPDADAYYPAEATRRHISGQTVARVCIDARARLASVEVVQSSGHQELDAATLLMIRHQAWKAATLDGKPVNDCRSLLFTFKLRSQQSVAGAQPRG